MQKKYASFKPRPPHKYRFRERIFSEVNEVGANKIKNKVVMLLGIKFKIKMKAK